ncbi:toxin RTX-I translocation ATP-binding protein [bacterium BMS3Bbin10]|nr:toxin RTX-I translocation ATP-binding protein [bacterium BMS3Bbin10]
MTVTGAQGREGGAPDTPASPVAGAGESGNPVHDLQGRLGSALAGDKLAKLDDSTPAAACLKPLLLALEWTGQERHLMEALPHLEPLHDIDDLRALLARIRYRTTHRAFRRSELRPGMLPCLFSQGNGDRVSVILGIEPDGSLLTFDGVKKSLVHVPADRTRGDVYLVSPIKGDDIFETIHKHGWVQYAFGRFRRSIYTVFALAFAVNVLALAVPIYVMNVYDKAIGAKSPMTLLFFLIGILIVVAFEMGLRTVRARVIAFLGARFESLVTIAAMQQLLNLPLAMTETAPISAQISRLKQFAGIRDLFVGQLGGALTDLPFVFVFLGAIFLISGPLGFIPLALFVVFLVAAVATVPLTRRRIRLAGDANTRARDFVMELADKRRSVRENGAEEVWIERCKGLFSTYLLRQFKAQQFNTMLQTASQMLVMVTGVSTVSYGAVMALDGNLSVGALIAVIALVWRLLSPIQAIFLGLNQIGQGIDTMKQVNNLMRMQPERRANQMATVGRKYYGHISIVEAGFRYAAQAEAALRGVSLDIPAGQVVAITGNSGAGKSTLLKLVAGLYRPQMGAVRADGLDLRQVDAAEYRQSVAYVPEALDVFYGTVAQNLKLADPEITPEAMQKALAEAGASDFVKSLPEGLDTRIRTVDQRAWTDGRLQQLILARAYVKDCPIYLLDDPGSRLDRAGDEAFIRKIKSLSGRATVLLVTHRPSHMRCADRVVVLDRGQIAADGPPDEVVPALLAQMQEKKVS